MTMKHILILIFTVTLAGFLLSGCTTTKNTGTAIKEGTESAGKEVADKAEDVGKEIEDGSITSAIKMKFANDDQVSASRIDVDTDHGHVTLTGNVSSQSEADQAVRLAESVDGVKSVHSNLVVQQSSTGY